MLGNKFKLTPEDIESLQVMAALGTLIMLFLIGLALYQAATT
jgi:Kef-type K+ transport system membrane component KefB